MSSLLQVTENTIIDLPTAVATFHMDLHEPRIPAIAVASGSHIYIYKELLTPPINKVHIYLEYHSVFPFVGIETPPPPPLPQASVSSLPGTKGVDTHSPAFACEGLGESQFGQLE
jgi:hypothetical protein